MSYIGSSATPLPVAFSGVRTQSFNGTGSQTAFTLSRAVSAVTDIEVVVNNVQQSPYDSSYNISGATLTFSEAPSSGTNNIYVIFRDQPVGSLTDPTSVKKAGDTMTGDLFLDNGFADGAQVVFKSAGNTDWNIDNYSGALRFYNGSTVRAQIDALGRVTMPYQPAFRVVGNTSGWVTYGLNGTYFTPVSSAGQANQTTSADGSKAGFNLTDSGTRLLNRGGHMNLATGTFTAPIAGQYSFSAGVLMKSATFSSSSYMNLKFFVNGSEVTQPPGQYFYLQNFSNSAEISARESVTLNLAANDQVQCRIRRASDGANQYQCYADFYHFEGYLIG